MSGATSLFHDRIMFSYRVRVDDPGDLETVCDVDKCNTRSSMRVVTKKKWVLENGVTVLLRMS